jgi:coenzyme PQQ precursor peptide PqqA
MQWSKPDFQEITLNMEVTAYVNTDEPTKPGNLPNRSESNANTFPDEGVHAER